MNHLVNKVDSTTPENLVAGLYPPLTTASGVLGKADATTVYPRGSVLARSDEDGKLYLLGQKTSGAVPDCVLCDDTEIGTSEDENAVVYVSGCFNIDALHTAEDYTWTQADKDKLRERGIYLSTIWD